MKFLRYEMTTAKAPLLLGVKAEVVFGTLLVARNRAVRLACVLALALGALSSVREAERLPGAHQPLAAFLIVGTLAAVAGSRLFAPGAALASSRRVVTIWWAVPVGRLAGALLVILPVAAVAVIAMELADPNPILLGLSMATLAAAVASLSLSLAPTVGSSTACAMTLATIWAGAIPTTAVQALSEGSPAVRFAVLLLWHTLPLPWRANRLLELHAPLDALVLLTWIAVGVLTIGWAASQPSLLHRKSREPA